jgi:hypothetical protein
MQSGLARALAGAIDSPRVRIKMANRGVEHRFMAGSTFRLMHCNLVRESMPGLPPVLVPG